MQDDRLRQLKDEFDIAHRQGMNALKSGDYAAFGDAVDRENTIIAEQTELIASSRTRSRIPPTTTNRRTDPRDGYHIAG